MAEVVFQVIAVEDEPEHEASQPVVEDECKSDKYGAALFMLAAFMVEAVQWSLSTSYGVFYKYYTEHLHLSDSRYLSTAGTLAVGIPFLGAPLATYATTRWRQHRRWMILAGWLVCLCGIAAASLATTTWQIILAQGLTYGLGFLVLYYPLLDMLNEWFVERRGLAYGILFAANGLGGAILPLSLDKLLLRNGHASVLRIYVIVIVVLTGPLLPFLKGPQTTTKPPSPKHGSAFSLPKDTLFYIIVLSSFFQAIAFYVPFMYLPTYLTTLSPTAPPTRAALLLSLLNIATILGQIAFGWLSDHANVLVILAISTLSSALFTLTLWLLARSIAPLIAYSLLYGLVAGGFSVLYARFVTAISTDNDRGLWLYGLLAFVRGVAYVLAGPVSGALLPASVVQRGDYMVLIICVGCAFAVSSLGGLGRIVRPVPTEDQKQENVVGHAEIVDSRSIVVREVVLKGRKEEQEAVSG